MDDGQSVHVPLVGYIFGLENEKHDFEFVGPSLFITVVCARRRIALSRRAPIGLSRRAWHPYILQ